MLKNKKGFTLVELLISLTIFTIVSMAVIPLLANALHLNKSTLLDNKARDIATKKIEDLLSMSREEINSYLAGNTSYEGTVEAFNENEEPTTVDKAFFKRYWKIQELSYLTTEPKPVVFVCVVEYTYKGSVRKKAFSAMSSF